MFPKDRGEQPSVRRSTRLATSVNVQPPIGPEMLPSRAVRFRHVFAKATRTETPLGFYVRFPDGNEDFFLGDALRFVESEQPEG
jgi:hypothetical protein